MKKRSQANKLSLRDRMLATMHKLDNTFVGRKSSIGVIALALLTRNNFLLVGDPGTAKTALIECFAQHIDKARFFNVTCGSFTTLDELVGPTDIKSFQQGTYRRVVKDMLPDCEIAFLDEVMKSNDGTINSLLKILNERRFEGNELDLWSVGGATNWPEVMQRTEKVEALYDRFVIRHHVECTNGDEHTLMLEAATSVSEFEPEHKMTIAELHKARVEVAGVKVSRQVLSIITDIVTRLKKEQVVISDRRSVKAIEVLKAAAWLEGQDSVSINNLHALRFVFWADRDDIPKIGAVLATLDQRIVQSTVDMIDTLIADIGLKTADATEATKSMVVATLITEVQTVVEHAKASKKQLTRVGSDKVNTALKQLGAEYKKLIQWADADLAVSA